MASVESILEPLIVVSVIILPALGITLRIALKPLVDSAVRISEAFAGGAERQQLERRTASMEAELQALRAEVARLSEAEAFHAELGAARKPRRLEGAREGGEADEPLERPGR